MKVTRTKHLALVSLASALVGSSGLCLAESGPHCAVDPAQIVTTGKGRGVSWPSGETLLPKPVLPAGNVARAPLTAATIAVSAAAGATSASSRALLPSPAPFVRPAPIPSPEHPSSNHPSALAATTLPSARPPASVPAPWMAGSQGPVTLPLNRIGAAAIAASPALRRIASRGATLYDLGTSHGMRGVFARNGRFFQVFYITPDGKAAIAGVMWNAAGRNVTLHQVRHIPDLRPTVKIGPAGDRPVARHVAYRVDGKVSALPPSLAMPAGSLFQALAMSDHGTIGKAGAPRVWMFMDPLCSYSVAAMRQLMPVVAAGKLRVSVVPLSILDYEDHGMSTPEAKIMLSQPGRLMASDWIDKGLVDERARAGAARKLAFNMEIAQAVHLKGTPTFLWRTDQGGVGRSNGLPSDLTVLISSIRKPS